MLILCILARFETQRKKMIIIIIKNLKTNIKFQGKLLLFDLKTISNLIGKKLYIKQKCMYSQADIPFHLSIGDLKYPVALPLLW